MKYLVIRRTLTVASRMPTLPINIKPSHSEISSMRLEQRNLEVAVRHLHQDGLVVVEDVIPHKDLDHLNNKMLKDALHTMGENAPFNYNQGNLQQDAPPIAEYFRSTIFANPIGIQITSALLGPNPRWSFCSGNTAMSSSPDVKPQRQPVHSDADFKYPNHPFALVINVPLVTMTPENGSTELWLGTHTLDPSMQEGSHGDRASGRIKEPYLSRQRALRPPSQPIVKKGSIVIRDLRLWHAGMPNYSNEVRVMLAMIHFSSCYRNQMRLRFAHDIKPILEKEVEGLEIPVDWISVKEAQGGYLNRGFGNSYDFNQLP